MALLITALLGAFNSHADTGSEAWVRRYQGDFGASTVSAVAIDSAGNVFVAGSSRTLATFNYEGIVLKYSASALPLWTNHYYVGVNTYFQGIATDSGGNAIVTGYSDAISADAFETIKYSPAGTPLWTNRFGRGGFAIARSIATDANDDVVVIGSAAPNGSASNEMTTIKYSTTGLPLWTNRYARLSLGSYGNAVKIDAAGDVIATGYSSGGNSNICTTIKYSNIGLPVWTNIYPSGLGRGLAVDGNRNVVVCGRSENVTNTDFLTICYSPSGQRLWTNLYDDSASGGNSDAAAVAVDASGNVFVTGSSLANGSAVNNYDYATVKYSSVGVPLWTNRYDSVIQSNDTARAIAVDRRGSVYVTGYSFGSATNYDYITIKYSNGGLALWTNRLSGRANPNYPSWGMAVAMGPDGAVHVAGTSSSVFGYEFATVKYMSAPAIQPLIGPGTTNLTVSWTAVPERTYQLQSNTNLNSGPWQAVTNIIATGSVVSVTPYPPVVEPQCFFRIIEL